MDEKTLSDPANAAGFKYFYELVVGSIIAALITFLTWAASVIVSHGKKIAKLETGQVTRTDFDRWREEQQVQLDEVRASTIESNNECVRAVERSQEKLEQALMKGLDRVEGTNRELLVALAKRGLEKQ